MGKRIHKYGSLAFFWSAMMELENIYSLFPKACNLSGSEYWSLFLIYEGFETQSKISDQFCRSRQTLNSAFAQLQHKGLVQLVPYKENHRSKQATLTDTGKQLVEERIVPIHQIEEKAWIQISEEDRSLLIRLTQKFSKAIQQEWKYNQTHIFKKINP